MFAPVKITGDERTAQSESPVHQRMATVQNLRSLEALCFSGFCILLNLFMEIDRTTMIIVVDLPFTDDRSSLLKTGIFQ